MVGREREMGVCKGEENEYGKEKEVRVRENRGWGKGRRRKRGGN